MAKNRGPHTPEYRRFTPPPMPPIAPARETPEKLDAEKIVECLKLCATGDFQDCKACSYRNDCNRLILDTIALLETGYDLRKEKTP